MKRVEGRPLEQKPLEVHVLPANTTEANMWSSFPASVLNATAFPTTNSQEPLGQAKDNILVVYLTSLLGEEQSFQTVLPSASLLLPGAPLHIVGASKQVQLCE